MRSSCFTNLWILLSTVMFHSLQCVDLANIGQVVSLFKGAEFVYDIVDTLIHNDDGETLERIEEMEKEISKKIDASVTTLLKSNLLQLKLERVEDTIVAVHSSLMDLNLVIKNSKEPIRERYEELFMLYYLNNEVSKHIRFLPTLLSYQIPGTNGKLLDVWVDHNRCNLTSLYVFKDFYFDLLSSGMAIEATFNYLRFDISSDDSLKEWEPRVDEMTNVFEDYETHCKSKFIELATEDVGSIKGAKELSTALGQRYPWKMHDVFCLKTPGTFQFIYYESKDEHIIYKETEDCRRLVVSIDKDVLSQYIVIEMINGELFRSNILSSADSHAALHVGKNVRMILDGQGYDVKAIFSYFDDVTKTDDILLDEASPALTTVVPNVTLDYCHKSGLECVFSGGNTVEGDMRVYFYVKRKVSENSADLNYTREGMTNQSDIGIPMNTTGGTSNQTGGGIPENTGEGIPPDKITRGFAPARMTTSPFFAVFICLIAQSFVVMLL